MRIAKWAERYETHETRKLKHLQWVPVPNQHDGLSFRKIAAHKHAADIFTAWVLMLQVASRAKNRGELTHDGKPLTAQDLSVMTGFPEHCFECGIPVLADIGWIEYGKTQAQSPATPGQSPGTTAESPGRMEGNGMEGKEGKEDVAASGETFSLSSEPVETDAERINRERQEKHERARLLAEERQRQASEIYQQYPKRTSRANAIKAICCALEKETFDYLMQAVRTFAASCVGMPKDEMKFVKHPATWFNAECYLDDPATWTAWKKQKQTTQADLI